MQKTRYLIRGILRTHFTAYTFLASALLCACATDDASRTSGRSSTALGYSGGGSSVAVATGSGGYGGGSGVAVATGSGGYGGGSGVAVATGSGGYGGGSGVAVATGSGGYGGGLGVAVGVGGYGSGVAVSAGNAGAYAGTGYGYVNNVGAVVAPVGGWYPFYYSSPLYASPVPQVYLMPQVQQTPYTYQPYYVQMAQPAAVAPLKP